MRNYYHVIDEIKSAERKLENARKSLHSKQYLVGVQVEDEDWIGVRTTIYVIASFICLALIPSSKAFPGFLETFCYIGGLLIFPVLSIIAAIRFVANDVGYRILSFSRFFYSLSILIALTYWSYFFLVKKGTVWLEEVTQQDFLLFGTIILLIPALIMLIGSIVKFKSKKKEKQQYDREKEILEKTVAENENRIAKLTKEAEEIKTEGERIYKEETSKNEADIETILKAADFGCKDAACQYAADRVLFLLCNKEEMAADTIQNMQQSVRNYIKQAEGCKHQKLQQLLEIWSEITFASNKKKKEYSSSEESLSALKNMCKTVSDLKNAKSDITSRLAQGVYPMISQFYCNAKERWDEMTRLSPEQELEIARRVLHPNTDTKKDDYIVVPVTPSGEVDLSGTSPMDYE